MKMLATKGHRKVNGRRGRHIFLSFNGGRSQITVTKIRVLAGCFGGEPRQHSSLLYAVSVA